MKDVESSTKCSGPTALMSFLLRTSTVFYAEWQTVLQVSLLEWSEEPPLILSTV